MERRLGGDEAPWTPAPGRRRRRGASAGSPMIAEPIKLARGRQGRVHALWITDGSQQVRCLFVLILPLPPLPLSPLPL